MLKILCCVKQVPDVDQMRMDPETGNLIRAGVPAILNPQDANALSAAMKVKETYGGEVTLITMGPPNAEAALLDRGNHKVTLRIPYSDAGIMDLLNREAAVTSLEYLDDGIKAEVTVPPEVFGKVKRYIPNYTEPKEDWED